MRRLLGHPITLWIAFVLVHLLLGLVGLYAPGGAFGDVMVQYKDWVAEGLSTGSWVGLSGPWVYPVVAILPMITAAIAGLDRYVGSWLGLVMVIDAFAFAAIVLLDRGRRRVGAAWWWLAFLLALGPIAVGRIDSIAAPVAIVALLVLAQAPAVAGAVLAVAAWIKVWPAALLAAVIVALRTRARVVAGALVASAVIVAVVVVLGGGPYLGSFVTDQTSRTLQVESVVGTFWMWGAAAGGALGSGLEYDQALNTFELHGAGVETASTVMTPLLGVAALAVLLLAALLVRRGVEAPQVLPVVALALVTAFIVFNKVGSPQYATWLAAPIVLFMLVRPHRGSRVPAVLGLITAGLTQLFYPYFYLDLLGLSIPVLVVLTARNLAYVILFVWSVRRLLVMLSDPVDAHSGARLPVLQLPQLERKN